MTKVRVAYVGAGNLANRVHYPSLAGFEDVEIVAACDLIEKRVTETARKFHIPKTYTWYRQMLDETDPDAVYAVVQPHLLHDIAADVLQRGKHLFVEKPPGVTRVLVECLAKIAADQGVVTAVGFQRRYHPMVSHCWQEVKAKGPVHQAMASFYKNQAPGAAYPYYRGAIDILRCDAIHAVDSIRYHCGLAEVRSVASEVRNLDAWYATSFNAIVHFENDAVGVVLANWRTGARFFRFEFDAGAAAAFADADGRGEVWIDNAKEPTFSTTCNEFAGSDELRTTQGFQQEDRAFIDAVKQGRQVHNSLQDAVKTMRLADRIYGNAVNR